MTWIAVVEILIRLLSPIIVDWLRKLLEDAADSMPYSPALEPAEFRRNLSTFFGRARGKTWVWNLRKRAALRLAERAALVRADDILRSATAGGYVPPLSAHERAELKSAIAD